MTNPNQCAEAQMREADSFEKLERDIRNCAKELLQQGFQIDANCTADEELAWADRLRALRAALDSGKAKGWELLLTRALPYVDTNPDLHRFGGDELNCEIRAAIAASAKEGAK